MNDLISRQDAIDAMNKRARDTFTLASGYQYYLGALHDVADDIKKLPSAQPTLYGYNVEHLALIASVLQKEHLPPERIVEVVNDIGRIFEIVKDEFEESLRKTVEQCTIDANGFGADGVKRDDSDC